jgi:hypothetical protein
LKGRSAPRDNTAIPATRREFHIPIGKGKSFFNAAKAMHNSTSFLHVSTTYTNGSITSHQYYRRAHKDDLGIENDGSYHHVRSTEYVPSNSKRAEASSGGLVVDYLWKDASANIVQYLDNNFGQTSYYGGLKIGGWMWDNSVLASCATLIEQDRPTNGAATEGDANEGIMAYGWNGSPFGFNGRSSGWISSCCATC